MSLRTVSARHIRLVSLHWTRYAVRSGAGLVFLILALLFGLGVAQTILTPIEMMIDQQTKEEPDAAKYAELEVRSLTGTGAH